jgi:hypothetical protein
VSTGRASALLDTRVIYCGDNLEQLKKLPDQCVDLIGTRSRPVGIDPPFNSNPCDWHASRCFVYPSPQ